MLRVAACVVLLGAAAAGCGTATASAPPRAATATAVSEPTRGPTAPPVLTCRSTSTLFLDHGPGAGGHSSPRAAAEGFLPPQVRRTQAARQGEDVVVTGFAADGRPVVQVRVLRINGSWLTGSVQRCE